jgi:hypothetical protein
LLLGSFAISVKASIVSGDNVGVPTFCATKAKVFTPKGQEACPLGKWTI